MSMSSNPIDRNSYQQLKSKDITKNSIQTKENIPDQVIQLLKTIDITHSKPVSTWDWIILEPSRILGRYFTIKTDSGATIYINKSSALKAGFKKESLKSEPSVKSAPSKSNKKTNTKTTSFREAVSQLIEANKPPSFKETLTKINNFLLENSEVLNDISNKKNLITELIKLNPQRSFEILDDKNISFRVELEKKQETEENSFVIKKNPYPNQASTAAAVTAVVNKTPKKRYFFSKPLKPTASLKIHTTEKIVSPRAEIPSSDSTQVPSIEYDLPEILTPEKKHFIASHITKALSNMHKGNTIHRNLQLDNIKITKEDVLTSPGKSPVSIFKITGARIPNVKPEVKTNTNSDLNPENTPTTDYKEITKLKNQAKINEIEKQINVFQMGLILYNLYNGTSLNSQNMELPTNGSLSDPLFLEQFQNRKTGLTPDQKRLIFAALDTNRINRPTAESLANAFSLPT